MQTSWVLGIHKLNVVAGRLQLVISFEFHRFNEVLDDLSASSDVVARRLVKDNLIDKADHVAGNFLVGLSLGNIGL